LQRGFATQISLRCSPSATIVCASKSDALTPRRASIGSSRGAIAFAHFFEIRLPRVFRKYNRRTISPTRKAISEEDAPKLFIALIVVTPSPMKNPSYSKEKRNN
jgi:hypothetical protein